LSSPDFGLFFFNNVTIFDCISATQNNMPLITTKENRHHQQQHQKQQTQHHDDKPALLNVPIIDLENTPASEIVETIAKACQEYGFFQILHHSISPTLIDAYLEQCRLYFALPLEMKQQWKRHDTNSRGWFNDELTKQKRDWKEALDLGVPGSRDWSIMPDDVPENHCLDGWNQLPPTDILPNFRSVVTDYFDECAKLADRIAIYMAQGLGQDQDSPMLQELRAHHSSYLRSNYYPLCNQVEDDGVTKPLGISPHRDAGFLTVLLQDADCHSLQVYHQDQDQWITVHPAGPYALTINTGDMAEVWSNGRYQAPLHRVLSHETQERYSTPFFYNPSYQTLVEPLITTTIDDCHNEAEKEEPQYHGVLWGYFRAVRFAGDLTDLGVEIQIADYLKKNNNNPTSGISHVSKQQVFAKEADFRLPFSVEKYRPLLTQGVEGLLLPR
jgi:isopenicillin N synthase-like dioxygenase